MSRLNESIISEINAIPDSSKDVKVLLKWLLNFERENSDRDMFKYKSEILEQVNKLIDGK